MDTIREQVAIEVGNSEARTAVTNLHIFTSLFDLLVEKDVVSRSDLVAMVEDLAVKLEKTGDRGIAAMADKLLEFTKDTDDGSSSSVGASVGASNSDGTVSSSSTSTTTSESRTKTEGK